MYELSFDIKAWGDFRSEVKLDSLLVIISLTESCMASQACGQRNDPP